MNHLNFIVSFLLMAMFALSANAQSYTYQTEGFEEAAWDQAPNSTNTIAAATGNWQVAKNNIRNTTVAANGTYSLVIATKGNALISPRLEKGAGILSFSMNKPSGGGRTISISTSTDNINWSGDISTVTVPSVWTTHRVEIDDESVRYIRFQTNSNGSVYIDDVNIAEPGAPEPDAPMDYWTQDFNNQSALPGSKPETPVEITVPGQGVWIYMGAYKGTNTAYIPDGSVMNLRMPKNGSYVITPLLDDGVSSIEFWEGRGDRDLTVYTSTDGGAQWTLLQTVTTARIKPTLIPLNKATINRIKIANESGSDADVDNIRISVFPDGKVPQVTTGQASDIGRTVATVTGEVVNSGSKPVLERGIVWDTLPIPVIAGNRTIEYASTGTFTASLENLPAGATIYFRAYGRSRSGAGYGEIKQFTTLPAIRPVVITQAIDSITGESAVAGGLIADKGGIRLLEKGICWNEHGNPTTADQVVTSTAASDRYELSLRNLKPTTTYYYKAFARNAAGTGYGEERTFTTGNRTLPQLTTLAPTAVLSYSITGGGTIISNGNAPLTTGLCWNEQGNPTTADKKTEHTTSSGTFTSTVGFLRGNTTYYIRAYATNGAGTAYGEEIMVTTLPSRTVYLSANGNDATADGSKEQPFYSLQKAVDLVAAGDSIILSGGTYRYNQRINIGTVGAPDGGTIVLTTKNGERALLDFSQMALDPNNQGIRLTGSYWYLYGLDIKGAGDNGLLIERNKPTGGTPADIINNTQEGNHNTIEFCSFFDNKDTGLQLKNMAAYNRVINCDSYFNRDAEDGNADGFAPKLSVGTGNYFYGCRAWNNSDDGWDGILYDAGEGFADDMTTIYENCWAFNNGFLKDGSESKGNGNGFKLGGSGNNDRRHNALLIGCLAFDNLMKGFDQNHNTGDMMLINCTGFANKYLKNKNHYTYRIDEEILAPGKALTLTNCVAVWDGIADPSASAYTPLRLMQGIRTTNDFQTLHTDYISTDTTGVRSQRQADGSLPVIDFMRIKPGNTKLIDKGTAVESFTFNGEPAAALPYKGTAPDLGCFETGDIVSSVEPATLLNGKHSLVIYPQPVREQFTLTIMDGTTTGTMQARIYDVNGREVKQLRFAGSEVVVQRESLGKGVYLVVVTNSASGRRYSGTVIFN